MCTTDSSNKRLQASKLDTLTTQDCCIAFNTYCGIPLLTKTSHLEAVVPASSSRWAAEEAALVEVQGIACCQLFCVK